MAATVQELLIKQLDQACAMEQTVARLLDGMIKTTSDPSVKADLETHREQTEEHAQKVRRCLEGYGESPSKVKQALGALTALLKAPGDLARGEQEMRNARDGFTTEHLEIATYRGLPLATYTAVLVSDTAIPVWHDARFELPLAFASSSATTAGAAAAMAVDPERAGPARRIAVAAALAENAAMQAMEACLGRIGEPYKHGAAGRFNKLAKGLSLAGAAVMGLAGRRRAGALVGGGLLLAGESCLRWSVFRAGFQSAADPEYTIEPQRRRREERTARA